MAETREEFIARINAGAGVSTNAAPPTTAVEPAPAFQPTTRTNEPVVQLQPQRVVTRPTTPPGTQATAAATAQAGFQLRDAMRLPFLPSQILSFDMGARRNAPPGEVSAVPDLSFDARNRRLDAEGKTIELDLNDTISSDDYSTASRQQGDEAKLQALQQAFPDRAPRQLDDGTIVMQIADSKTGLSKDVPINREGMDYHDLKDFAAQLPEMVMAGAAAYATRGKGFINTIGQTLASAFAANYTGQVRDVATRALTGIPIDPEQIARARNADMYLELFVGNPIAAGVGKSFRALSPFAGAGPHPERSLEFNAEKARGLLSDVFNLEYRATPAERTGNMALRAVEAAEGGQPGARTVIGRLKDEGLLAVHRLIQIAGGKRTPEEEIGSAAIGQLQDKVVNPLEKALKATRDAAEATGQTRILKMMDDAAGVAPGTRVTPTMAGVETLDAFEARRLAAKQAVDADYKVVRDLEGGTGDVLSGDVAADAVEKIRRELPAVLKEVEVESDLVDRLGRPIKMTEEQRQVLKSGMPENLQKSLDDIAKLRGGKVSLETLTKLKTAAYDEIARTEAVPGVKDRWFNEIAKIYEMTLQAGIDETGDPALKAALTKARDTYKRELLPFDRPGVKELARSEFDAGRLSPQQVTARMFEGPKAIENYALLKETLGASNPAFKTLKRAFIDTKISEVTDKVMKTIDAGRLGDTISALRDSHPELAEEIFGSNVDELQHALRSQSALRQVDKLTEDEVTVLLGLKNPGRAELKAVRDMTLVRDKSYVNSILKDVADGLPISSKIKPTELVNRLRNVDTPTEDVKTILAALDEDTREAIATATFYDILDRSSLKEAKTASAAMRGDPLNINPTLLAHNLGAGGSPTRLRNELLLGDTRVATAPTLSSRPGPTRSEVIQNIVDLQAPRETTRDVFRASGQIAGAANVLQITKNPFQYATSWVKKTLISMAYMSDWGTKFAGNEVFTSAKTAAIANALIVSEPFVARAVQTLGPETAEKFITDLKGSIDKFVMTLTTDSPENRQRRELEKVGRGERGAVRLESSPSESKEEFIRRVNRGAGVQP